MTHSKSQVLACPVWRNTGSNHQGYKQLLSSPSRNFSATENYPFQSQWHLSFWRPPFHFSLHTFLLLPYHIYFILFPLTFLPLCFSIFPLDYHPPSKQPTCRATHSSWFSPSSFSLQLLLMSYFNHFHFSLHNSFSNPGKIFSPKQNLLHHIASCITNPDKPRSDCKTKIFQIPQSFTVTLFSNIQQVINENWIHSLQCFHEIASNWKKKKHMPWQISSLWHKNLLINTWFLPLHIKH